MREEYITGYGKFRDKASMVKKLILFAFLTVALIMPLSSYAQSGKPSLFNKWQDKIFSEKNGIEPFDINKSHQAKDNGTLQDRKKSRKEVMDAQIKTMHSNLGALAEAKTTAYKQALADDAARMQLASGATVATPIMESGGKTVSSSPGKNKIMVYDPEKWAKDPVKLYNPQ
jgi:hypothetical protein